MNAAAKKTSSKGGAVHQREDEIEYSLLPDTELLEKKLV